MKTKVLSILYINLLFQRQQRSRDPDRYINHNPSTTYNYAEEFINIPINTKYLTISKTKIATF